MSPFMKLVLSFGIAATLSHYCETAAGDREEITGRVTAVEFFYLWLLSLALMAGVVRWWKAAIGDETLESNLLSPPRLCVGLMLTFAAACATAEPSLDRGVNLPHGVYLNVHETHYPVTGADEEGIGRSLQEGGPTSRAGRKVAARFEWDMRSNWSWTSTSRGCAMEDVEITVTARVTMPRWDPPAGAPAELELSWEQFLEALRTHEQGHHDHIARAARELHRSLTRLEVDNCSFILGYSRQHLSDYQVRS